jgi:hypothetical protein
MKKKALPIKYIAEMLREPCCLGKLALFLEKRPVRFSWDWVEEIERCAGNQKRE